jgi:hypothetical protein
LTPAKSDSVNIDPRLKSIFTDAVARGLDVVDFSPQQICDQFMIIASEGVDLVRPPHIKLSLPHREPEPEYIFDRKIPHRIPTFTPPLDEPDDTPLGVYIR